MSAMDPAPERYEIQRPIGHGGHAEVLLGVVRGADGFQRPVAIKRVRADLANQRALVAMLIEEAHHAARLCHPNVVSVLDLARDAEGRPYLVMEHVDGVNLATLIETGPLPFPVAIFLVRELLSGLGYLHEPRAQGRRIEPGLVHRDVKPRNVLLSWEGAVKLADFGLAQMLQRTEGVNALVGTPSYMSPEQVRGEDLDGRSDLYAIGIMLWELLASRRLRAELPGAISTPITFSAIPRPSVYRPVPADLEAVAVRLLANDRDDRYPTAELAAHDLMRCQDVPRDGRAELFRLLDERFPRSHRRGPFSRPPETGSPSTGSRTATVLAAPTHALAAPCPKEPEDRRRHIVTPARARRRWQWRARAYVVLALVLAMTLTFLVLR